MFGSLLKKMKVNRVAYNIIKYFVDQSKIDQDCLQAYSLLEKFLPNPRTSCCNLKQREVTKQYDLDIIVPAYNAERYIKTCLDSVLSQKTKWNYRIIVIDDGSTDKTGQILDKYENDKRVKIIHQENRGFSGARNRGLNELDSRYVIFLDSDDILLPNSIELFLNKANELNAAVVEGGFAYISEDGKHGKIEKHREGIFNPEEDGWGYPWGKVLRSDLFNNIEFPENFWFEDTIVKQIIYPLIVMRKEYAYGIKEPLYGYRIHQNSISYRSVTSRKSIDTLWITLDMFEDRKRLGLRCTQTYYENILDMVKISYLRTKRMPLEIQKALFIVYADFIQKNLYQFRTTNRLKKDLESALYNRQFSRYRVFCELI